MNRRDFLRAGASVGALMAFPRWVDVVSGSARVAASDVPPIEGDFVRELALRAVDAARAAGATYSDVRLTHTRTKAGPLYEGETSAMLHSGVRALVNGYWGFASSTAWTPDEMDRLARAAVHQAKTYALGQQRVVDLGEIPAVNDGHWVMPIERDPFDVPDDEILDLVNSLKIYTEQKTRGTLTELPGFFALAFQRQDKAFASSEGSYYTQRLYRTSGNLVVKLKGESLAFSSPIISGAGRGWEYVTSAPLREEVDRVVAELEWHLTLPEKPVEVGRYDVVFDAASIAMLLDRTLGAATELDRALGYEANASGTSYLADPLGMLGSYQAGAPSLTVTADRTVPGGLATVKWDDEGVGADQFVLVKDGILADFQTHREATGWLPGRARSHGCAAAPHALEAPLIHTPNLAVQPGQDAVDFDGLVSGIKRGLVVKQLSVDMDFQCLNGFAQGRVYEIRDGKYVSRMSGAGFLLRAPEFWRRLSALGGPASQRSFAKARGKGEPPQATWHTVAAVPAAVEQVTTIAPAG